jgi:glucose-6-phosphate 1-dehydrogenase
MNSTLKTNPTIITIFGGSGDLTWRKLIPALYNLFLDNWLNEKFSIICTGLEDTKQEDFIARLQDGVDKFSRSGKSVKEKWDVFSTYIHYRKADFTKAAFYNELKTEVENFDAGADGNANKIFYLAVNPLFFGTIVDLLNEANLVSDRKHSRLVIEKPFGTNLETAKALNKKLLSIFEEKQLYRIDHYLGKETVQNILAFRFANALFEPTWNRNYIDHVQISVAEKIGVEDRGGYYDNSGALRDMVQNHVMQLLCLVAMEPPVAFDADEIRNKKADVLHAIRKIKKEDVHEFASRGQYGAGWQEGTQVKGYREEKDVPPNSNTETFAALKLFVDNWRWSNVPFYIRSGKRMQQTMSVITIQFKPVPHQSFPDEAIENWQANKIIINLQPDMGIRIRFQAKKPGLQMQLNPVDMMFNYNDTYSSGIPEGYETLLLDVMEGDATLFMRADQVEAAWDVVMPILQMWEDHPSINFPNYAAGSNGPETAEAIVAKEGDNWMMLAFDKKV